MKTFVTLMVLSLSLTAAAQEKQKIAALQIKAASELEGISNATGAVLANELQRLELFEVTTMQQVQTLLSHERQKQLVGVEENVDAMTALGEALKADFLVSGSLARLKSKDGSSVLSLELILMDAKAGKRISSEILTAKSEGDLVTGVGPMVVKLMSKVLAGRMGSLYVESTEAGANVLIDGSLVGTTPLDARIDLPGGPHMVRVEKEGFVAFQKEVRVKPDRHLDERAALVPSPDFIEAHKAKASRMRMGAYIATGVAVAGIAGAGYFQYATMKDYGAADRPGTFAYHQSQVNQGIESDDDYDHRAEAQRLKAQIEGSQRFLAISAGAAVLGAAGAAYFFIAGESPSKYNRYDVKVTSVALVPMPGGGAASVVEARF